MNLQHDELDDQMEEAVAGKNKYDDWLGDLTAQCIARGVAVPQAYQRQRMWNDYQRKLGAEQKKENSKRKRLHTIERMIETLQAEKAKLLGVPFTRTAPAEMEEPSEAFFAEMEADLVRRQEQMDTANANATREQRELALRALDAESAASNEGEIID